MEKTNSSTKWSLFSGLQSTRNKLNSVGKSVTSRVSAAFAKLRKSVSAKTSAILLAGVASSSAAFAAPTTPVVPTVSSRASSVLTEAPKAPVVPAKRAETLSKPINIAKKLAEAPVMDAPEFTKQIARVTTKDASGSLNIRNDNGEVIRTIGSGKRIILDGERKEVPEVGTFIKVHSWVNHKSLSGWVALEYLSLETPKVKKEVAAKEMKKVDNFVPSITQADLAVFSNIHRELSEKTEIFQIDIDSFKRSIARNEWNGSLTQNNAKEALKRGVNFLDIASWIHQFTVRTQKIMHRLLGEKGAENIWNLSFHQFQSLFLQSEAVQEVCMHLLMLKNLKSISRNKTLSSGLSLGFTPEALLAAMHYSGIKWAELFVRTNIDESGKKRDKLALTGKTDWLGKTDITTYVQKAMKTYEKQIATTWESHEKEETRSQKAIAPTAANKLDAQKTENGAIISADFTKKASPIRLKPEQEIILRERLSNYIQGTQIAAIIAKKDAYKKARHGMTSNSMTDIIASLNALMRTTELREQSLRAGTPVIAFYNGKIKEATSQKERIERKLSGAYSPDKRMELLIEQEINNFTLELLSREFAYAKSSVQGILSGKIGEKTPVMISRNTVSKIDSALKKAA